MAPLTWEGAYLGGALGYAFNGDDEVGVFSPANAYQGYTGNLELSGAYLSLRGGYRWERENWVFGPELSIQGGNIKDSVNVTNDSLTGTAETKEKYGLTLSMKTGYKVRPETIVYGRAGVAYSKFDYKMNNAFTGSEASDDFGRAGYLLGLGAEHKLNDRLSVTGEVNYRNFGSKDLDMNGVRTRATPKYIGLEVGLNYQF